MSYLEKKNNLKRKFHSISSGKIECSISNLSVAKCSGIKSSASLHSLKRFESSSVTLKKIKREASTIVGGHKSFQFCKELLKDVIILGQAWDKVIVALSLSQHMIIVIDQHALHERIRYEYYHSLLISRLFNGPLEEKVKKFDKTMIHLKEVVEPTIFKKSYIPYEQQKTIIVPKKLEYHLETVSAYGIEYDLICRTNNDIIIRVKAVSCILGETLEPNLVLDVCEFLASLEPNKKTARIPRKLDEILMSKACKNAIKFNDKLDPTLPDRLISQLLYCEHPLYCVHGRNSIYPLSELKNAINLLYIPRPKRKFRLQDLF